MKIKAKNVGLEINQSKTKYMVSTRDQVPLQNIVIGQHAYEGVDKFTYLGSSLNTQNKTAEEIKIRLISGNK
jgi:hypothetical protein